MKMVKYIICFFFISVGIFMTSCTREDAYKEITKDGEIYYPGRADTVEANGGRNRIQLRVHLGNDPLVNKVKVYWKNYTDSVEANVVKTTGKDVVDFMFDNIPQGAYSFDVYTYNAKNARSIVKKVNGMAYGDNYQRALSNRTVKSIGFSPDGNRLIVNWNAALDGEKFIELKYIDENGLAKMTIVPGGSTTTVLPGYKEQSKLSYRSIYLPEPHAIDEFTVDPMESSIPLFERQLDKSKFKELVLPTDVTDNWGWLLRFLWDENYGTPGFASTYSNSPWFTFDMGESVSISKFKTWQASDRIFRAESIKRFEIWGSNNPALDGSWGSWTKLADCKSLKPSGLPGEESTAGDIEYAKAGEEFKLPKGSPKVRYLRIKVLETWGNGSFITMGELGVWTSDKMDK